MKEPVCSNNFLSFFKYYFIFFAVLFVLSAVYGVIINYSPIPFWDMWSGYLDFYVQTLQGNWTIWFDQHNEHRIVLSRVLFWIDLKFFNGSLIFLLLVNFLLLSILVGFFIKLVKEFQFKETFGNTVFLIMVSLQIIVGFSWMQQENLTWAFQSQFFLAYLLPLTSFYLLYQYQQQNAGIYFYSAILVGVVSACTMANGVLTLPVLFLQAFFYRVSKVKLFSILVISLIVNVFYFYNLQPVLGHQGSLVQAVIEKPVDLILYILTYFGSPFFYIFSRSLLAAQIFGLVFIVLTFFTFYYFLIRRVMTHRMLMLVLFSLLLYIGATALGTAGGRVFLGVHQAIASRYLTPVFLGWLSLLILLISIFKTNFYRNIKLIIWVMAIVPLLLLDSQGWAFKEDTEKKFEQRIAVLAMEMSVNDVSYIEKIFPLHQASLDILSKPKKLNLSIFGHKDFVWASEFLKTGVVNQLKNGLMGNFDQKELIEMEGNFIRIQGWAFDPERKYVPEKLMIVNSENQIVGYALTGMIRNDVVDYVQMHEARYSGFKGYLLKHQTGKLSLIDPVSFRSLSFVLA